MKLIGHTVIKINGKTIVDKPNAISLSLKGYLRDKMYTTGDEAINNLFQSNARGSEGGRDGITLGTGSGEEPCITTVQTPSTTFAKKWKGEYTASGSYSFSTASLGHGINFGTNNFDTVYATQTFTQIDITANDIVEVFWEIRIGTV